ncbi:MAG: amidohydrolase [Clostridia bacterium]|nr:amidohydrolase [Clostridia bacterium]
MKHIWRIASISLITACISIAFLALPGATAADPKATAAQYAAAHAGLTTDIAKSLWDYAEIGLAEYKSYIKVHQVLADAGFSIVQSVAGVPTALVAAWGSGAPVLGIYEDIDALPGIGHGCGHNLNTAAGVVAAISIKEALQAHGLPGTVKIFINPAEEVWDVAPLVAAAGYYDDVDALISFHASDENGSEYGSTMAMDHVEYKFKGKAAHASAAPEKGLSALDAVEIMNVSVNYLREHLIQEMRIHYVITDGGAAPNIVPATAASRYFIRGPKYPDVSLARARIDDCAKGAALATGTELEIGFSSGIYNKVPNKTLAYMMADTLKTIEPAQFSATDMAAMEALGVKGVPDAEVKEPTGGQSFGSDPIGDVTWKTPSATMSVATWTPGAPGHSASSAVQSGSVYGIQGAIVASQGLASIGMELLTNADSLGKVKAEFAERMKGLPPYEGKAIIPDVAYPEAPGVGVTASSGTARFVALQTEFKEASGDQIIVTDMAGAELGKYTIASGASADQNEISFPLSAPVAVGQRLKVVYVSAIGGDQWLYGYIHAK